MSQPLVPTPRPVDAAATLAATKSASPDMLNRREIPVTSFDFLNGEFSATRRVRLASLLVVAAVSVVAMLTLSQAVLRSITVSQTSARIEAIDAERRALVAEFGADVDGVPTVDLIARDLAVSDAVLRIAALQGDFPQLLAALEAASGGGTIVGVSYGAVTDEKTNADTALLSTGSTVPGAPAKAAGSDTVLVTITVAGTDLAATAAAADRILQLPGIVDPTVSRDGATAVVAAKLRLSDPPDQVRARLTALGIRADFEEGK